MKKELLGIVLASVLMFAGCSALNKAVNAVAPNQTQTVSTTDPATGVTTNSVVEVPGTHTLTPIAADTAAAIPYGTIVVSILLLGLNGFQMYQAKLAKIKSDKTATGLVATVQAIELASQDPTISAAIAKLKVILSNNHQVADVQPLINDILAQLKLLPTQTV